MLSFIENNLKDYEKKIVVSNLKKVFFSMRKFNLNIILFIIRMFLLF